MELHGRDDDRERLIARLRTRRLVTLTGPGGIGKSTLARSVLRLLEADFDRGSVEVDLTRIDHSGAVAGSIAAQLGYPDFDALINTPDDRSILVLVDNCEHVLDQAADALVALVDSWPAATVLTTSRSPLDVPAESLVVLGPLATPGPEAIDLDAPALALLVERAADHGVHLDPAVHGGFAAEIVRRLDGVPLAIELAAAQLRSMTVTEIAADLETRTHALARPRFRGRPRHRSVAELIDWSYGLLSPDLARLLDDLAVFAGPFTVSMAGAVAAPDASEIEVRGRLDELVNASLIDRIRTVDGGWFRLLYPVRAVARRRLADDGRERKVSSRYVDHIVEVAVTIITRSSTGWDATIVTDLLALFDNLSAALRWTLDHDENPERAELLVAVLWGVVHQAHAPEVARLGEAVLARWPDSRGPSRADAAATVATCRNLLGDHDGAIELAQATLDAAHDSPYAPATLQRVLAQAHRARFDNHTASQYFRQGAEAAEKAGMHGLAMELWTDHGAIVAELGDLDRAVALIDTALERAKGADAQVNVAWCLAARGSALAAAGLTEEAQDSLEAAIDLSRRIHYPAGIACGLRGLAAVHMTNGNRAGAASALLDVLSALQTNGNLTEMRMVLDGAALVLESVPGSSWVDLATTAADLPITNVATPMEIGVLERVGSSGQAMSRREAFIVARRELEALVGPPAPPPTTESATEPDPERGESRPSWIAEGDVWRLTYRGRTVRLRRSKGLADLARLLAEPDRELHVLDLAGTAGSGQSSMSVLDEQARRSYEERVRDLQAEIEAAEDDHDIGRIEQLRTELDAVVDELTTGLGLGGRLRTTGGDAERARSAVTRRIRDTIRRIADEHEALGRHLDRSIQTGVFCSYRPDTNPGWAISDP